MIIISNLKSLTGLAGTTGAIQYSIMGTKFTPYGETPFTLAQGTLTNVSAALYTPVVTETAKIQTIVLTNTSGTAVSGVILMLNDYQISPNLTIPAHGMAIYDASNGWSVIDQNGSIEIAGLSLGGTPVATTPLALSAEGTGVTAATYDHTHQSPGGISSLTTAVEVSNSAAETKILSATMPANFMKAGTTFRIWVEGTIADTTSAPTTTFRVRCGTTTLTGNIACSIAPSLGVSLSATNISLEAIVTVLTAGSGGTILGNGSVIGNIGVTGATLYTGSANASSVAVDTTATKIIEVTFQFGTANAANAFNAYNAAIEVIKM